MKQNITKTIRSIPFIFLFICCFLTNINAQNIAIEQDAACINCPDLTADLSAALEVRASDKGILVPRVANTSAISNPAEGLVVYDNADDDFKFYDGSEWQSMGLKHISFPATANTFVGIDAGTSNTTGILNTGIGAGTLSNNTSGTSNTAMGYNAMQQNTIGVLNIAIGVGALGNNTTGGHNTAVGPGSLGFNTTGGFNAAIGRAALERNTSGSANTGVGWLALTANTTGSNNTAVGYQAFQSDSTSNNSTALGFRAQPTGSNQVRLGNSSITSIGGYANWSNISDARFKKQVQDNVPGLAFISLLNPVTYQMDMDAIARHHNTPDDLRLADSERAKAAIRYTGFLAQEVEQAAKSVAYDFSGVDAPQHERDNYSLRYAEFVVPLVKAVQELEAENKALRAQHADMEARLGKIEALLRQRAE